MLVFTLPRTKIVLGYFLLLFALISCSQSDHFTYPERKGFISKFLIDDYDKTIQADSIFSDIDYILLKEIEGGLIGSVDKAIMTNEHVLIFDRSKAKALFAFDHRGEFKFKIGNKGGGPGEFVSFEDFDVTSDYILTYDSGNGRLSKFDFNGRYIGEGPKLMNISVFPEVVLAFSDTIVSYTQSSCSNEGCFALIVSDSEDQILYKDLPNDRFEKFRVDFGKGTYRHKDKVFVTQLLNDTIYKLNSRLELTTPYVIDFGKSKISEPEANKVINDPRKGIAYLFQSKLNLGIVKVFANDQYLWVQYLDGKDLKSIIIDTQANAYRAFQNILFDPRIHVQVGAPVGSLDNQFIFYQSNEVLQQYQNAMTEQLADGLEFINQVSEKTNGIIAVASLKPRR